ncbi:hypothetical protein JKF63_02208 [Porcisia hertigi]|uniref:dual-specificity kinase n=1 Tax=Porcisia hertigi TaxID=2761500 RepID=A0A836L1V2_9TRYP|nr:hypothetical protein JKF63_02208 [Porcisia hertigi]
MHLEDGLGTSCASPISASKALHHFGDCLTAYEKTEILQYGTVYYAGQRCINKVKSPTDRYNNGYDTEEGEYVWCIKDHIAYRYEVLGELGGGAFGQVLKALDHANRSLVAVKLIRNQRRVLEQAEQEIRILQHVNDRDPKGLYGIVRMKDNFKFRGHICITYELLGANLYEYLKAKDFFPMSLSSIRSISARMLVTLTYLARENIIHGDLKPENILLRDNDPSAVKLVDLGSASFDTENVFMYIQSRFYRAPEVILEQKYGKAIDWWSFGCILCELANGDPVFSGEDEKDQLGCIMEYLGPPPVELVAASSPRRKREFFDEHHKPRSSTMQRGKQREPGSRSLARFLAVSEDDDFLSFVRLFLQWDPSQRATPREAMTHRWICDKFVFPTVSEERTPGLSSLAKENRCSPSGSLKACMPQTPSVALDAEDSTSATVGRFPIAPEVPLDSLCLTAARREAHRSALFPLPPTLRTVGASTGAFADADAVRAGTAPTSRNAPASTAARRAVLSTDTSRQWPPVRRRLIGRIQRGWPRRSIDMANVEIPGRVIASPSSLTLFNAPLSARVSSEKEVTRDLRVVVYTAPSATSFTRGTSMKGISAKPHMPSFAGGVLSPEVLSPSANCVVVTPPRRDAHSPEGEASPKALQRTATSCGAMSGECAGNGLKDTHASVLELHRKGESSKAEAETVDMFDRSAYSVLLNDFSRWPSTTGAVQSDEGLQESGGMSPRQEDHRSMPHEISRGLPIEQAIQERREYSINLDAASVSLRDGYYPASVRGTSRAEECVQHSELPPYGDGASASNPRELEVTLDFRHLAAKLSGSCVRSGSTRISLQSHGSSLHTSNGSLAAVVPFVTSEKTSQWRSTRIDMTSLRERGAADDCKGHQHMITESAAPLSVKHRVGPPSGMRLVPPRQMLGQQSLQSKQSVAGAQRGNVERSSTASTLRLPQLKWYSAP